MIKKIGNIDSSELLGCNQIYVCNNKLKYFVENEYVKNYTKHGTLHFQYNNGRYVDEYIDITLELLCKVKMKSLFSLLYSSFSFILQLLSLE